MTNQSMVDPETITRDLKREWFSLQELMSYLESQQSIGAKEYSYCQLKLKETVQRLERIERALNAT